VLFEKESSLPVRPENLHREVDDDHKIHSFIVRVWVEKNGDGWQSPVYRGQVVCLPNRERHYIKQLEEIITLIQNNLDENQTAT
jgi:hypothetical protein